MGVIHIFVDDLRAQSQQAVDHLSDGLFVAGDGAGGNNDEIAGADLHVAVAGLRHAGQRRQRLALAAGGDKHDFLRRVFVDLGNVDEHIVRHMKIAQFLRHLGIGHHTAPADGHLAAVLDGQVHDLLDTINVGGEGRYDNALFLGSGKQPAHPLRHRLFGSGKAGTLGVGGIRQQRKNASAPILRDGGQVRDRIAGQRRVVDLEVAGMNDNAGRTLDGKSQRIGNGMVHMDRLHRETAQLDLLAGAYLVENGAGGQTMLLQLVFDQSDGELGRIDGHIELFEQIRQTADMIFMTVGDKQAFDTVFVFQHIGEIRNDQINAEHLGIREHQTAVHKDHIPLTFVQGNVFADLAKTAQRTDVHGHGGLRYDAAADAATLHGRLAAGGLLPARLGGGGIFLLRSRLAGFLGTLALFLRRLARRTAAGRTGTLCGTLSVIFLIGIKILHENLHYSAINMTCRSAPDCAAGCGLRVM